MQPWPDKMSSQHTHANLQTEDLHTQRKTNEIMSRASLTWSSESESFGGCANWSCDGGWSRDWSWGSCWWCSWSWSRTLFEKSTSNAIVPMQVSTNIFLWIITFVFCSSRGVKLVGTRSRAHAISHGARIYGGPGRRRERERGKGERSYHDAVPGRLCSSVCPSLCPLCPDDPWPRVWLPITDRGRWPGQGAEACRLACRW